MKADSVLRRECCYGGIVLYNYRGSASQGKVQMEKIWGFECCWHFPKGLFTPRTYLLMLAVMMGCQRKDKVLWVNHRPLQWSRSTDAWPWWTLGCNRETKRVREKKNRFLRILNDSYSFSHKSMCCFKDTCLNMKHANRSVWMEPV